MKEIASQKTAMDIICTKAMNNGRNQIQKDDNEMKIRNNNVDEYEFSDRRELYVYMVPYVVRY